jgi:4-amino-4-deoxy-L-arabinose transferase-like glycosyltransferase
MVALILAAAGWKVLLLFWNVIPFNADEAIVGLMGRHILEGSRPVFFYGQAYMGSLDAFLVAAGFFLFGEQVWVIRFVQIGLYAVILATTFILGYEAFGSWRSGLIGVILLVIPPVNVSLYTTASLGGYGEALLIGNLVLVQTLRQARSPSAGGMAVWGLLAGVGLWANGLTLVYSLPALAWLVWQINGESWRKLLILSLSLTVGGLLGATPWWLFALQNGIDRLVLELLGSAVAVEEVSWISRSGLHLFNLAVLGFPALFGFRPPWAVDWLALPLLPLALFAWLGVAWFWWKRLSLRDEKRPVYLLFGGVVGVLCAGFIFTSFGVDPSGRYFLPLAVPLALVAGEWARNFTKLGKARLPAWIGQAVIALLVVFQFWGNLQTAFRYPPGLTTQFDQSTQVEQRDLDALVDFLRRQGQTRGYTHYWVAYPLAFRSGEDLIFVPRLPYHADLRYTSRDNRYPRYNTMVAVSEKPAYITTRQTDVLDQRVRDGLDSLKVDFKIEEIGDFRVYYDLSRTVRPEEIGLGEDVR